MQSSDLINPLNTFINKTLPHLFSESKTIYFHFPAYYGQKTTKTGDIIDVARLNVLSPDLTMNVIGSKKNSVH